MPGIILKGQDGNAGLYATTAFAKGKILLPLTGSVASYPTRYSVQSGPGRHLVPVTTAQDGTPPHEHLWRFANHSCDPNARLDLEARTLVALREIRSGEEVTFDYNTTEWDMASPFECHCGTDNCYGTVRGFKHLPADAQRALLPVTAPHIRHLHNTLLNQIRSGLR